MRWVWIIPAILIMILPEAVPPVVAAGPETLVVAGRPVTGSVEPILIILMGGILVCLAAIGRRATRRTTTKTVHRVPHAPAFTQTRH